MKLDDKIKELEHKLATKKAYLAAQVVFPKGGKEFPSNVIKAVKERIKEACVMLAEEQEVQTNTNTEATFTSQEIAALKSIAQVYFGKSNNSDKAETPVKREMKNTHETPTTTEDLNNGKVISQKATGKSRALLLTLDSVDRAMRRKVDPQSEVIIIETKDNKAFVQDQKANRFWVLKDDLESLN